MSARLEVLAVDKQMLVTRSALCRLRLRRATHELRVTLDWKRATVAAASASVLRPIAFGLALSFIGAGRAARLLKLAAGVIVLAKLARFIHERPAPPNDVAVTGDSNECNSKKRVNSGRIGHGDASHRAGHLLRT